MQARLVDADENQEVALWAQQVRQSFG